MSDDGPSTVALPAIGHSLKGRRLSDILLDIAREHHPRVSVGNLLDSFGNRAFGAMIFIFAVPNALPVGLPGLSAILGAPLLFLTWQLMVGQPQPWLPTFIRARSFKRRDFSRLISHVVPWVQRIERMIRPRSLWMTEPIGERLIGCVGFVLTVIVFLPIPLGNMLPGFALSLLAIGILERDGMAILLGTLSATISLILVSGVIFGIAKAALFLIQNALL